MRRAQDYLDEMKSGSSNAIFLVMWPIFNVLLVHSNAYQMHCLKDEYRQQTAAVHMIDWGVSLQIMTFFTEYGSFIGGGGAI